MSALVPRIQKLVFENKQLAVSKTMRDAMKGTCLTLDEYRTSHTPFSDDWQCAAAENNNFGESAYCPSERVIKSLSQYAGVSLETFSKFHLRSSNESDALYGKWCGMPAPPEYEHPYGGVVGARVFWEDHNGRFGLQGLQTGKYEVKYGICPWLIHFHTTHQNWSSQTFTLSTLLPSKGLCHAKCRLFQCFGLCHLSQTVVSRGHAACSPVDS